MVQGSMSNYPKTLKNRPFLNDFFQLRPLSGQQRPDGQPDGFLIQIVALRDKFCFFPYIIHLPILSPIKVDSCQTHRHTHRHTDRHPYFIINIDQGLTARRPPPRSLFKPIYTGYFPPLLKTLPLQLSPLKTYISTLTLPFIHINISQNHHFWYIGQL